MNGYINVDGTSISDDLPVDHQKGSQILGRELSAFHFWSLSHFDIYQTFYDAKPTFMNFFDHVANQRPVEMLMIAERCNMAQDIARNLSGNNFQQKRFYKGVGLKDKDQFLNDDQTPYLIVYEFYFDFYGYHTHVWITCSQGHIFQQDFIQPFENPQDAFRLQIVDKPQEKYIKFLPELLQNAATGVDALVLWMDNDIEGEAIGFEVIKCAINSINKPPQGSPMDVIYRAKFSTPTNAKAAMTTLERPNFRRYLSKVAQNNLDFVMRKSFAKHQRNVIRGRYPFLIFQDLPFEPRQNAILAIIVRQHLSKKNYVKKFGIQMKLKVDDCEIEAILDKDFENEEDAKKLCEELKKSQECKIISDPSSAAEPSVKPPLGLNTFELLAFMSKHFEMSTMKVLQVAQRLYENGYITYPRTASKKYPEKIQTFANRLLLSLYRRVSTCYQKFGIGYNETIDIDAAAAAFNFEKINGEEGEEFAIIPTEKCPNTYMRLKTHEDSLVYAYICCRFIASFMPEYKVSKESVIFGIGEHQFRYSYFKKVQDGFTKVLPQMRVKTMDRMDSMKAGTKFIDFTFEVKESPPKLFTELELIEEMEKCKLGVHATIPFHIPGLQKMRYIKVEENTGEVIPTELGISIFEAYNSCIPEFMDPSNRAKFSQEIHDIGSGDEDFVEVYDKNLGKIWKSFKKFIEGFNASNINLEISTSNPLPPASPQTDDDETLAIGYD